MRFLEALDRQLRRFLESFERLPATIGRAADRALEAMRRYTDNLVELIRTAVSVIVRFLRDLLVSLLRLVWNLFKLAVVALVPCYLFAYGMTIEQLGHSRPTKALGWTLAVMGVLGMLLIVVAIIASFAKDGFARTEAGTVDAKQRHETRLIGFVFADLLAILAVAVWVNVQPAAVFHWWPLSWTGEGVHWGQRTWAWIAQQWMHLIPASTGGAAR